jgi:hypothetical protein
MTNIPTPQLGVHVLFVDEHRQKRDALVKHVWPGMAGKVAGVNLVIVSDDVARTDSAGRQTEIKTSVPHMNSQPAGGYGWMFAEEDID